MKLYKSSVNMTKCAHWRTFLQNSCI